jgi:hypothetical protein
MLVGGCAEGGVVITLTSSSAQDGYNLIPATGEPAQLRRRANAEVFVSLIANMVRWT